MKLKENERIDDLGYKGLKIIQNTKGFCFGIDSVLLTAFAKKIKDNSIVADLGTGTGIIGLLLCKKTKLKKVYGIEIQKDVAEMANRSVILNGLQDKMQIIHANIQDIEQYLEPQSIDVVVTNPPYQKYQTGLVSENESHLLARHEVACTLEDIIIKSYHILKSKGQFYMIHRPERLVDILYLMRKYRIEPKELQFVYPKFGEKANLILIKGVKHANEFLKIKKPLIVYDANGNYTEEILKIYHKEKE